MRFTRLFVFYATALLGATAVPPGITFQQGASNVVTIEAGTSIYGLSGNSGKPRQVLLTHARRDAIAGAELLSHVSLAAPAAERDLFEHPDRFWAALETARFHDYAQQSTKVPVQSISVQRAVVDGDIVEAGTTQIRVISTPGYTRGAVSYLFETGGKRIACTGDLIYGDGQLLDLYSLQDAVPEAKARGYHGYAARAGDLIASLRKVAAAKPDIILPAHGPAIDDPASAISRLIERLQALLASHFEVDALRWYWGEDNFRVRSRAVERNMDIMPMAEQVELPGDIRAIGNSRLIVSRSGAAFLIDAGYNKLLPELRRLRGTGTITSLDGIWITHYHDDHTDYINDVAAEFHAPVYFTEKMSGVLARPGAFRLPCLTTHPIPLSGVKRDGETLTWREWQFTFLYFPGQTLYHGGLLAKRQNGQAIFFVGDSFTPSGMDDYCMQNRDFLGADVGYAYCLRKIAALKDAWLINQHVPPMFRFTSAQLTRMQRELDQRSAVLKQLSPWPDINYLLDESWARLYPYGSESRAGATVELHLRVFNHSPDSVEYRVKWNSPVGWQILDSQDAVDVSGRQEGSVVAHFKTGSPGLNVVTTDVSFADGSLSQSTEALVRLR